MSTAPIRKALEALRRKCEADHHGMSADEAVCLEEALTAVEAIEKAARVVAVQGIYEAAYDDAATLSEVAKADLFFQRLAKETKP